MYAFSQSPLVQSRIFAKALEDATRPSDTLLQTVSRMTDAWAAYGRRLRQAANAVAEGGLALSASLSLSELGRSTQPNFDRMDSLIRAAFPPKRTIGFEPPD